MHNPAPKNKKDTTYSIPITKELNSASAKAAVELGFDRTKMVTSLFLYLVKHNRLPQELVSYCMYLEASGKRSRPYRRRSEEPCEQSENSLQQPLY